MIMGKENNSMLDILKLLERNGKLTAQQLADMTGRDEKEVSEIIAKLEADNIITGYSALIDWEKVKEDIVTALIEVRISPQRGEGFDRIAERIYQYDEVESLYLMSGAYDLCVFITGRSMKEVSHFVFARLAPLEGVTGTATHFILKKYKEKHITFSISPEQEDRVLFV